MVTEHATVWPPVIGGSRCIHVCCKHFGSGMRLVPPSLCSAVLKRVRPLDREFSDHVKSTDPKKRQFYLCDDHLDDHRLHLGAGAVLPFSKDPVVQGLTDHMYKRNQHGEVWWATHRPRPDPKPAQTYLINESDSDSEDPSEDHSKIAALQREVKALRARNAGLVREEQRRTASEQQSFDDTPKPMHGYLWTIEEGHGDRCKYYTSLDRDKFIDWVEMVELLGAVDAYTEMARGQKTTISFRDAITIAITRLRRIRGWRHFEYVIDGATSTTALRRSAIRATIAVSACVRLGVFGPTDKDVQEARRVPSLMGEFGPGGDYGPVGIILDGIGIRVEYPSPPGSHREMHSQYKYDSIAQFTIGIDQAFDLCVMTDLYSGSSGETKYVIASKILDKTMDEDIGEWWHLEDGVWVMTDKGYNLAEYLKAMGCYHVKPTEMMGGSMAASESARSRRVSQPRSASERMVFQFKRFDIFNGKAVCMSEWPFLTFYKDVIGSLIKMNGPLTDNSGAEADARLTASEQPATPADLMAEDTSTSAGGPADLTADELAEIADSVRAINLDGDGETERGGLTDGSSSDNE
eukprot:m.202635 g.202635  ORF g.202635 m.202635 type:complete len:578 (-) comp25249_c2_seq10:26-1759(-)